MGKLRVLFNIYYDIGLTDRRLHEGHCKERCKALVIRWMEGQK